MLTSSSISSAPSPPSARRSSSSPNPRASEINPPPPNSSVSPMTGCWIVTTSYPGAGSGIVVPQVSRNVFSGRIKSQFAKVSFMTLPKPITVGTPSKAPTTSTEFGIPCTISAPRMITVCTLPPRHCASSTSQSENESPLHRPVNPSKVGNGLYFTPPSEPTAPTNVFSA